VLYVGVTNNLARRGGEHKQAVPPAFTGRYGVNRLVWFEPGSDIRERIAREKQLKGWIRRRKIALIEAMNPTWRDLSEDTLAEESWSSSRRNGNSGRIRQRRRV
jgi:putative endonuclease